MIATITTNQLPMYRDSHASEGDVETIFITVKVPENYGLTVLPPSQDGNGIDFVLVAKKNGQNKPKPPV